MRYDLFSACAISAIVMATAPASAQALNEVIAFRIAPQSLEDALIAYSEQSGVQVLAAADLIAGKKTRGVSRTLSASDALKELLAGTGLSFTERGTATVSIVKMAAAGQAAGERQADPAAKKPADAPAARKGDGSAPVAVAPSARKGVDEIDLSIREEIVVTGSSIRGVIPESSPLEIYSREEFANLGVTTVDQLLRNIPQNLSLNSPVGANTLGRATNARSINAPDLRGLGPGATLTLLNGRRLPLANVGRASDTSLIPLGAVERVEVLTDGASSIYGADAVGGVINFVLRDDYDGAETAASYTGRSDGGYSILQLDQSFGTAWQGGGLVAAFSVQDSGPFRVEDADFTDAVLTTLAPDDTRYSGFLSVHQEFAPGFEVFADLLYSDRSTKSVTREEAFATTYYSNAESKQLVGTLGFRLDLVNDLRFEAVGTYGKLDDTLNYENIEDGADPYSGTSANDFDSLEVTAKIDGSLFDFNSNSVMFALGAGYLKQGMVRPPVFDLTRETRYAFGELQVPLVGENQDIPLVQKLELNISSRYTDTDDFGNSFDPKVGLLWRMNNDIALRGTWSQAFRAPEMAQLVPLGSFYEILPVDGPVGTFPDPFSDDLSTVYFAVADVTNPNLGPERSDAFTVGFDWTPEAVEGLKVSATYYNIKYTDRVAYPPDSLTIALTPELYPELISDNVSVDIIEQILQNAEAIFDYRDFSFSTEFDAAAIAGDVTHIIYNGLRNIAAQKTSGIDGSIDFNREVGDMMLSAGATFVYMLKNEEKATPSAPVIDRLDTITYPVDFRGRAYFGLAQNGWSGRLMVNYVDSYMNTAVSPSEKIDSWTTFDLVGSYSVPEERGGLLGGMRFGITVRNVFNSDPPFARAADDYGYGANYGVPYDASNHDPFGRQFVLSMSKQW